MRLRQRVGRRDGGGGRRVPKKRFPGEYFCAQRNRHDTIRGWRPIAWKHTFFSFLADDDLMLPHFLETALSGFQRHPEAALSILPTLLMSPSGLILYVTNLHWPEGLVLPPGGTVVYPAPGNPGLQHADSEAVWDEFGGFDEATDPSGEYDFDLRVMARLPVVVSKEPGAIQVMHHGAFTATAGLNHVGLACADHRQGCSKYRPAARDPAAGR